jgi:hypothetical protein
VEVRQPVFRQAPAAESSFTVGAEQPNDGGFRVLPE